MLRRIQLSRCCLAILALMASGQVLPAELSASTPFEGECQATLGEPFGMSMPHYAALIHGKRDALDEADHKAIRAYHDYLDKLRRCKRRAELKATDPVSYVLIDATYNYEQRQAWITPNEQRIASGGLSLASALLTPFPPLAVGTGATSAYVSLASDPETFAKIYSQTLAELLDKLRVEMGKPENERQSLAQIQDRLEQTMKSGDFFGGPGPDVGRIGKELVADVFAQMKAELKGKDDQAALKVMEAKKPKKANQATRQATVRAAIARRQAVDAQAKRNVAIAEAYRKTAEEQSQALNDRAAYDLEDRYMRGLTGEQRESLLDRFDQASEAQRLNDPSLRWLVGAAQSTRDNLKKRALFAKQAAEISKVARDYAAAFDGAYKFATTFKIGGPDLHKALAASSILASSLASASAILATGGVATPLVTLQILGVMGNLAGSLGGVFGDGDDGMAASLAAMQKNILEAIEKISLQVDRGFYLASLQSEEQRQLSELILAVATQDLRNARDGCIALEQILSVSPFGKDPAVRAMLIKDANHERLNRCITPLLAARDFSVNGAGAPSLMSLKFTAALNSAVEPSGYAARQMRANYQAYVDATHPALLRVLDLAMRASSTPADASKYRPKTVYEMLMPRAASLDALQEKLQWFPIKDSAPMDIGSVLAPFDHRSAERTLRLALRTPIDENIVATYLYPVWSIAPFLRLTQADFRPLSADLPADKRKAIAVERDSVAEALFSSYWPTTMTFVAQERIKAGDFMIPTISAALGGGRCADGLVEDGSGSDEADAERQHLLDACDAVREFPALRDNVLYWRLRQSEEKVNAAAGRKHGRLGLAYEAASRLDDLALSNVVGPITSMWLNDVGDGRAVIRRRFVRLAGDCEGIVNVREVAAMLCEGGKCRAPLQRGQLSPGSRDTVKDDLARQEQLRVCVMAELPSTQDFAQGILKQTPPLPVAERLESLYRQQVIGTSAVQNSDPALRGLTSISVQR